MIAKTWRAHWEHIVPFLAPPAELRRAVYGCHEGRLGQFRDVGPPSNNRCFGGSDSKEAGVRYVGIDWAYRRAAWCALREGGEIAEEGLVAADEDGLAKLVLRLGPDVSACVEMSGAVWVRDRLRSVGWQVEVCGCAQGQAAGAVGVQDRQGRRARAGRVVPPRLGAGGVAAVARGSRSA
jgi:hypothetical protein